MDMDRAQEAQEDLAVQAVQEAQDLAVLVAPALEDLEDQAGLEVLAGGQAQVDHHLHHLEAAVDAAVCHL